MNDKQKKYSCIIILITFISVEVMIINDKYNYGKLQESSKQNSSIEQRDINKEKQKSQNNQANKQSSYKLNSQNESTMDTKSDNSEEDKSALNKQNIKSDDSEIENNYDDNVNVEDNNKNSIFDEESAPTVSIFKIDKNTILNKISMTDKAKLIYLSRKLSIEDYNYIQQDMKSSNEIEASKDIFTVLKKKLSNSDYEKVKNILSPYINVDYIDKNILN